ncbi:Crp/Fnr family transcriptional regulator [Aurantimonas sp. Leaf443]|uniref:Crp/Fnr family transcriptional regulator n=1 Tax=Aurantimonas sp. Leaf443 TaxID=1736378 RepID=UPI0006F2303E|nr:Crp/Fnr family transcriptional regulator [Aurantimonas sp. Leaf443]KQT87455.1 cyclic nucleotide-binding protein [Aurantimonas sp. Leaf443]
MSLEGDIRTLRQVPLFEDLETDQLRLLAFGADHRQLRAGEVLFREAARADAGFVIVSGTVVMVQGEGARERVVGRFGPGTLLGEIALVTETRRPATARTESDCALIRIPRPVFRRMLEEFPAIAGALHERFARQLADMTRRIAAMESRFAD